MNDDFAVLLVKGIKQDDDYLDLRPEALLLWEEEYENRRN